MPPLHAAGYIVAARAFCKYTPARFCRRRTDFLRAHEVIVCRRMPPLHAAGFIIATRVFCRYTPCPILPSPPESCRLRAQRFFAAIRRPSGNTRKPILSPFVFVRYRYRAVSRNFSVPRKTGSDGTCLSRNATPCALPRLRLLRPNIKTVKFAPDSYTSRIKQIKP